MNTNRNQQDFDAIHSKVVGLDIKQAQFFSGKVLGIWCNPNAGPFTDPQILDGQDADVIAFYVVNGVVQDIRLEV